MRFWMRFIHNQIDRVERGLGNLVFNDFQRGWPAFRDRAIESVIRKSVEQMLPQPERFLNAEYVGAFWNRTNSVEVDLVGGDRAPVARRIDFIGSIKWGDRGRFTEQAARELAAQRNHVPGAETAKLVGIAKEGFEDQGILDVRLTAEELVNAWRIGIGYPGN